MEYVLLHFDHFKQTRCIGLLQFLVTFQDFSQPRIGPRITLGAGEGADLEPFKRKEHTSVSYCVILPAQLPSPPQNQKEARLGVLSELLAASRSLELAGWALAWKWWVPDSRRPFKKEETGKTQWITKITQWSQVWNGTSASSFTEGMQQGRMRREGGCLVFGQQMELGQKEKLSGTQPLQKATAEASSGGIRALGICYPTG